MIRWLRLQLAAIWYWRHVVYKVDGNFFAGNTTLWCGHCGGTIRTQVHADRRRAVVAEATCPAGLAHQRIDR